MRIGAVLSVVLCFGAVHSSSALAQCSSKQLLEFTATGGKFGQRVSFDGDVAVVAAGPIPGTNIYALRVYERLPSGTWIYAGPIGSNDLTTLDGFGAAFAVGAGRIAVLAPHKYETVLGGLKIGAIYVFEKQGSTWSQSAKFSGASVPGWPWLIFGIAINDAAVFGWGYTNAKHPSDTLVSIKKVSGTWSASTTLTSMASAGPADAEGDLLVIADQTPSVYVYESAGSVSQVTIPSWASTVSVSGGRFAVGQDIYEKLAGTWTKAATLPFSLAPAPTSVVLGDDIAVLTSHGAPAVGTLSAGAATVCYLENGEWVEKLKLFADVPEQGSLFGTAVDVSDGLVMIGAREAQGGAGEVILFGTTPNAGAKYGTGCAGSGGFVPTLNWSPSYDGCFKPADPVALEVGAALGGSTCLLGVGTSATSLSLGGGCTLLTHPSPISPVVTLGGTGVGDGALSINATLPAVPSTISVYLQAFVADAAVPQGYAASNGLRLTTY